MIEPEIVRVVGPLVGGRLFPDTAPADTPTPFAIFQQVGGTPTTTLENAPSGHRYDRFQITVSAKTRLDASTVSRQIESAMQSDAVVLAQPIGSLMASYAAEVQLYDAMQDFNISWSE